MNAYLWLVAIMLLITMFFCLTLGGCQTPSDGWYQRVENQVNLIREASQKNEVNTGAVARKALEGDQAGSAEWRTALTKVQSPVEAPPASTPFSDWSWIAILAGVSMFSPAVANKLQDLRGSKKA